MHRVSRLELILTGSLMVGRWQTPLSLPLQLMVLCSRLVMPEVPRRADFRVYTASGVGLLIDEGVDTFGITGLTTNINVSSNYATNINTGTSTGAITLGSSTSGAFAVDSTSTVAINSDASVGITTTDASGDITIDATLGSVIIDSGEAAADAIVIVTTGAAGGIDITSLADIDITTTGTAGEDISITNTGGSVNITATEADAGAILIQATAAGGDLNLDSVLGRIEIEAEEDVANAIYIIADGGTTTSMTLFNDTGTSASDGAASIQITSDLGGIELTSALAAANQIRLNATGIVAGNAVVLETTDGGIQLNADGAANGDISIDAADDLTVIAAGDLLFSVTGSTTFTAAVTHTAGSQNAAVARTATVGGATTGLIAAGTSHVTITCDTATKQITLPASVVGTQIVLVTPTANGCELICTTAGDKINDVICGGTNEAALVADSHYVATCISATEWILVGYDKLGAHIAPIVPDTL
jgi:hypothetical protein